MRPGLNKWAGPSARSYLTALVVIVVVVGCASARQAKPHTAEVEAARITHAGVEAASSGDYLWAAEKFRQAVKIHRSVDNRRGEIENSVNLARVLIKLKALGEAEAVLVSAINLATETQETDLLPEVLATLAKLKYLSNDAPGALKLVEKAIVMDTGRARATLGGRLNLKGVILIGQGRRDEAFEVLTEALALNSRYNMKVELANSYRALAELTDSLEYFEKALDLDRTSGDTAKIALDLRAMGEAYVKLGRTGEAPFYLDRAYRVYLDAGMHDGALESLALLIHAHRELGEDDKARYYTGVRDSIGKAGRQGRPLPGPEVGQKTEEDTGPE